MVNVRIYSMGNNEYNETEIAYDFLSNLKETKKN